jgi:NAD(P)-dependent dehydrogenase (short-subunit alcohol dehydrogenase family)
MSRGLGALVAQKYAVQGCNVAINYLSSKDVAEELASSLQTQYGVKAIIIQGVSLLSAVVVHKCAMDRFTELSN